MGYLYCIGEITPQQIEYMNGFSRYLPSSWRKKTVVEKKPVAPDPGAQIFVDHFLFLQKMYSETLLSELSKNQTLKEEYFSFFIPKQIKNLDMKYFRRCCWNALEKKLLEVSDSLVSLSFATSFPECNCASNHKKNFVQHHANHSQYENPVRVIYSHLLHPSIIERRRIKTISSDELVNVVSHLPNVQMLSFAKTSCTNETLKAIGEYCPFLRSLDVSDCARVTEAGLKHLFQVDETGVKPRCNLQNLNVKESGVEDSGVAYVLKNMPSIQVLSYVGLPRVLKDVHSKESVDKKIYNLTELEFSDVSCAEAVECLSTCNKICPKIKKLNLYRCRLDAAVLDQCLKFDHLDNIVLCCDSDSLSLDQFLKVKGHRLSSLVVSGFSITASLLTQCCQRLKTLSLTNITYPDVDSGIVAKMQFVTFFSLLYIDFNVEPTASAVTNLMCACTGLEMLRLIACTTCKDIIMDNSDNFLGVRIEIIPDDFMFWPRFPKLMLFIDEDKSL